MKGDMPPTAESAESEVAKEQVKLVKTVNELDLAIMQSSFRHAFMPLCRLRTEDLPHLCIRLLLFKWTENLDLTSIQTQAVSHMSSLHIQCLQLRLCNLMLPLHHSNALHCHHLPQGCGPGHRTKTAVGHCFRNNVLAKYILAGLSVSP